MVSLLSSNCFLGCKEAKQRLHVVQGPRDVYLGLTGAIVGTLPTSLVRAHSPSLWPSLWHVLMVMYSSAMAACDAQTVMASSDECCL